MHSAGSSALRRPKVVANFAVTWDGRISTRNRTPSDFSSPEDKARLLRVRSEGDAVLASFATVQADTMTMGLPDAALRASRVAGGQAPYPLRVIWSGSGRINPRLRLFSERFSPVVVYAPEQTSEEVRQALSGAAELRLCAPGAMRATRILHLLAEEFGVGSVVLEGGGALLRRFLEEGCVDELCLTWCPYIFGGQAGISLTGTSLTWLPQSVCASLVQMEQVGNECFTRWRLKYGRKFQLNV